jgi:ATP-binding cassette, subfamily C, bacterial CydD
VLVRRRLLALVREAPAPVAATVLLSAAATACSVGQALALAEVLYRVLGRTTGDAGRVVSPLAVLAGLVVARALLLWARDLAATRTAAVVKRRLRAALAAKVIELGPGYQLTRPAGATHATVADGVETLQAYVGFYLPQVALGVLGPLLVAGWLVVLDPVAGSIAASCAIAVPLSRPVLDRLLGDRGRRHWAAYERFAARMHDALQGITTLKLLGATERYGVGLQRDAAALYRATMGNLVASAGVYCVSVFVITLGTAAAIVTGALRYAGGHLDLAALLLLLFLTAECFRPMLELQNYWHEGFYGLAASHGVFRLLDAEPPVRDPASPRAAVCPRGPVEVRFERVGLRYPGAADDALIDVDIAVPAGSTVALVGRSGAGKSSLVTLLQRFLDPTGGRVLIDGVDLRELAVADARALTAVVSQQTYLFHGTVADNLRLARPDATDADLVDAARRARVHEVVRALPGGYRAVLGERGQTLSGGERQRLAIAQALLKDAPVLVLDEATSSVDGVTEAALREALAEAAAGRTTLMIAHRLSTVADADQVVVLDGGRVVEAGPPRELLAGHGAWAGLVAAHDGQVVAR